jgi:chromosomal replication initiation ATPase DnaA
VRKLAARTTPEKIERVVEREFQQDAAVARKVKLYLYHRYTGQSLKEIGNHFGIKESGVSQASRRFSEHMKRDLSLRKRVSAIKTALGL